MTSHEHPTGAPQDLRGKVALITGAGKRIGRAIAIALAEAGVHVVVHDRHALIAETNKVCGEVVECGAKSWQVLADLERPEEYESLIVQALRTAGSLDILVNNASIFLPASVMDVGFADVTRHLHINAWTPFVLSRDFTRLVKHGKIINILDTRITGYDRTHVAYVLSKRMLSVLTIMCALEFAPGFTVNAVAPGLILPPAGKDESYLDRLAEAVPLQRHGGTRDITDAVLYLLRSDFLTGQIIYADGGKHLGEELHGPNPNR